MTILTALQEKDGLIKALEEELGEKGDLIRTLLSRVALREAQLAIMQAPIGPQDRWYVYWAGVKPNINDNTLTPPVTFEKGVNFIIAERVKRAEKLANEENRNASKS